MRAASPRTRWSSVRHPHLGEHVVVVGDAHVVEAERDADAGRDEPAQRRDAGGEPQVRRALWTTVVPVRARISMSASLSQTPCASALRGAEDAEPLEPLELAPAGEARRPRRAAAGSRARAGGCPRASSEAASRHALATSSSLAHCGAMIANWALRSGSPRELARAARRIVST